MDVTELDLKVQMKSQIVTADNPATMVARVFPLYAGPMAGMGESVANLMAAAPQLLLALEKMVDVHGTFRYEENIYSDTCPCDACLSAAEAISQARGRG